MKRFKKTVTLVIEGSVSGSSVEISVRPTEEIMVTDLCIDNGGGTECRRIFLEVHRGAVGGVTVDADTKSVSGVSIGARLDIRVE